MGTFFMYLGIGVGVALVVNFLRMLRAALGGETTLKIIVWLGIFTLMIYLVVKMAVSG